MENPFHPCYPRHPRLPFRFSGSSRVRLFGGALRTLQHWVTLDFNHISQADCEQRAIACGGGFVYFACVMLWKKTFVALLALICGLALCGCNPPGQNASDEEKEPQFLIGRSRVNAMNFAGAIEAFEQALEKNPQSGAAHFELGWLYAEKEADSAAAIYHYQKYLKLRPTAANSETIKEHIFRLKQELAKGVLPVPASNEMQKQLEQLVEDNRKLNEELIRLKSNVLTPSVAASRPIVSLQPSRNTSPIQTTSTTQSRVASSTPSQSASRQPAPGNVSQRQYRVQAGDTPSSIARRYNVKLESLLTANPTLNPRRLQVGQSLAIPGR